MHKYLYYWITFVLCVFLTACASVPSKQITDIPLSKIDRTEQVALQLDNGLQVLIISDPNALQSSVAISVGVGSFQEPKE
ncbi:hypothetical protein GKC56_05495 [Neisseriaceae bacterium PsAf]|nr:hypothetical protein [Neisseriaceae bacterium PsAf]